MISQELLAVAEYSLVDELEGVPAHSPVAHHVMTALVLPLPLPLWPLHPGGQHGAVVSDCVVDPKEQHVFLTWSLIRLLRHLTNKHSQVHEMYKNIDLHNYTLIISDYYFIKGQFK